MNELLYLKCKKCKTNYEKPSAFKKFNIEKPNVFFKWSLKFCDKCRREKELLAFKELSNIILKLSS